MGDILKLIKEVFGTRILIVILLIVILGYFFKTKNNYQIRQLFYDRWYLISCLMIVAFFVSYWIYNSGLAERTPIGKHGIYLAHFKDDPDKSLHTKVFEKLKADLDTKSHKTKIQLTVRNLKRELKEEDEEDLENIRKLINRLNASVMIWGTATDNNTFYPRIWSRVDAVHSNWGQIKVDDLKGMTAFSEDIWNRIEPFFKVSMTKENIIDKHSKKINHLEEELNNLKILMTSITNKQVSVPSAVKPPIVNAILIGIENYNGPLSKLRGPRTDVNSIKKVLLERNINSTIDLLLDEEATYQNILDKSVSTAKDMDSVELFFIYLSGHGWIHEGVSYYFPFDYKWQNDRPVNSLDLSDFIENILKLHPKTIFIFDTPFDSARLDKSLLKDSVMLIGGPAPNLVLEVYDDGKYSGAFTSALVKAFNIIPKNVPVEINQVFNSAYSILKIKYPKTEPYLIGGNNSPKI